MILKRLARCGFLPIISGTDNKRARLVKLNIVNGRYFVCLEVCVAKNCFYPLDSSNFSNFQSFQRVVVVVRLAIA